MKSEFSKKAVIFNFGLIIMFTIACFVYQFVARESISEVLIGSFFGFCTTEMAALAAIKNKKIKHNTTTVEKGEAEG